jgi:hypothetical protein
MKYTQIFLTNDNDAVTKAPAEAVEAQDDREDEYKEQDMTAYTFLSPLFGTPQSSQDKVYSDDSNENVSKCNEDEEDNDDEESISDMEDIITNDHDSVNDPSSSLSDLNNYELKLYHSNIRLKNLTGKKVKVVSGSQKQREKVKWTVIEDSTPHTLHTTPRSHAYLGIRLQEVLDNLRYDSVLPLAELYLYLSHCGGDWRRWLDIMNAKIAIHNESRPAVQTGAPSGRITRFKEDEFLIGHALLIGAADCADRGRCLWEDKKGQGNEAWQSIAAKTVFTPYMKLYRFKQFRKMVPKIWEQEDLTGNDPWFKFRGAIENFNHIRKLDILSSEKRILDESMSAFRPRTSKYRGLPNISYIIRKPEPLGTEFKTSVCPTLNIMTYMEVCKGKEGMKNKPFHHTLGATTACAVRMAQGTCQSTNDNKVEIVKGDSWFGSVKSVVKIKTICPQEKEVIF